VVVEVAKRVALALGAVTLSLVALEVGLRAFVKPSPMSAGRLLGSALPPMRLVPREPPRRVRRDAPAGRIRHDDLNGLVREDAVLGYAPREDAISANGWWQSNNLGARARHATEAARVSGKTRVLVFGDSFAAGSRVPQESAWPAVLEAANPALEVVSLGVDGYSAAQSLLRYRTLADRIEHDVVLLTQSPRADFWREVNTLRALAGWRSYTVMPRFVLEGGRLQLIPSPYDPPLAIYADNRDAPSPRLREHLQRYDRFFVPWMYDTSPGLASHSVLAKLVLARWHAALLRRRHEEVLEPGSEAVAVSGGIARAMHDEARAHGARFLQVLLPSELDLGRLQRRDAYREQWQSIAAAVGGAGVDCVDLADTLLAAPAELLDRGFDGTHHGPRANRLIAEAVARALAEPRSSDRAACLPAPGAP
jgi:lysophospholipase L1-like esterase